MRLVVWIIVLLALPLVAAAQELPMSGRDFTFGVIEGAEGLEGSDTAAEAVTELTLTVVCAYEGCGTVISPSGYAQDFSFSPNIATWFRLPFSLVQLHELGKSKKGLLVHTTQP